jgi:Na+/melibiose symporter-like transporter
MGSVFFLSRQHHPPFDPDKSGDSLSLLKFLRELPKSDFGRFTVFIALTNFAMMMASPIIQAYLLVTRKLDYLPYTMITMASTVGAFLFMTYWGGLSDRFGNRRILIVTSVVLPALALAWVFVRPVWALVLPTMSSTPLPSKRSQKPWRISTHSLCRSASRGPSSRASSPSSRSRRDGGWDGSAPI